MKKIFLTLFGFWAVSIFGEISPPQPGLDWTHFKSMAIQNRGRLKPIDTYARETVQFVTGKVRWEGYDPAELIFNWLTSYEKGWDQVALIRIDYSPLKEKLGIDKSKNYFKPVELRALDSLKKMVQEAAMKQNRQEKLNDIDRKVFQIQNQLGLVEALARGEDLTILPNPKGVKENWFPIAAVASNDGSIPLVSAERGKVMEAVKRISDAYTANNPKQFEESTKAFATLLREELSRGAYPSASSLAVETHYNHLRPFRWAWVAYTIGFFALLGFMITLNKPLQLVGALGIFIGFGLHNYGFVLRCLIAGRPPVTNMYESVIWVTWGCVGLALLIWAAYKNNIIPAAASVFAVVGLVLADNLPSVLDPGIHPLEPVLRSNFWLTIHVLTITLSYAAFALSLCLGNVIMGFYLFKTTQTDKIQALQLYMYRAVQIGVVLIAAGTILGGVWADYSWGRFWGWDPKEVWALIALLLYLAVLHGRFTGWLKGFGFAAATVICFLGVLMAWYGVNFVLGVGLHSYGFGTGGTLYINAYILAQLGFIVAAYLKYRKADTRDSAIFPRK